MAIADVRKVGKLPNDERLKDEIIQPHLDAAARELKDWLGGYDSSTGEKAEACRYAECCLAMANFLLAADTFYTEGMLEYQKQLGEIEFVPNAPGNTEKLMELWWRRARNAVSKWMDDGNKNGISRVGWYAI